MKRIRPALIATSFYAAVVTAFYAPQLLTDRVLLPTDNLVSFAPWREQASELDLTRPNNALTSDAVLQNVAWRRFVHESWARGEPPLWNPSILGGQAFLAAAQNQALYPPALALAFLPVTQWYETFIAFHLLLAMVFTHLFTRALGATRTGSVLAGITFGLCGFLIVSTMWPQMIATAIWLPLLLWAIERLFQRSERSLRGEWRRPAAVLAAGTGLQFLAGHPEISFYNLAASGLYAAIRLVQTALRNRQPMAASMTALIALGSVLLGGMLASAQLLPFRDAGANNFRSGQVSYDDVRSYALPKEGLLAFVLPNFFGNPTHHEILDLTTGEWRSAARDGDPRRTTEWGTKNFVEGTAYVGVVPLFLGAFGVFASGSPQRWPLVILAGVSLLLAFGTPLLAPLYFLVPGYDQLHTPFRWVFLYGFAVAVLAGLGLSTLGAARRAMRGAVAVLLAGGLLLLLTLMLGLVNPTAPTTLATGATERSARLAQAFPDGAALFSYEWMNLAVLAVLLIATGVGLSFRGRGAALWLVGLTVMDLFVFGAGFSTAGDPRVIEEGPPAIRALLADATAGSGPFRITAFGPDMLPANTAALFGLEDIRGYDSLIPRDYVQYLSLIEADSVRTMLLFSKIESFSDPKSLSSPLLDPLGVRYVLSVAPLSGPGLTLVLDGPTKIYRRESALPRAMLVGDAEYFASQDDALARLNGLDLRSTATVERPDGIRTERRSPGTASVQSHGNTEVRILVSSPGGGYVVLFDYFASGWRAFVDGAEHPIYRADGIFRAVEVSAGEHVVTFVYRPFSWVLGALLSAVGLLLLLTLIGLGAWQRFLARVSGRSTLSRVLKNALVPMAAGTINKALDLGLAVVMLRILGPADVGRYTWAVLVVGYLDILANFGLGVLLTRDIARDPSARDRYLGAAALARSVLSGLCLLIAFAIAGPLAPLLDVTPEMALALVLLATGMAVSNLSGLVTAIFNARERMEYPAYVGTITAILKLVGGIAVLTLGFGIVGLAALSIAVNVVSAAALVGLLLSLEGRPGLVFSPGLSMRLIAASYPLMLNNLLASLFLRVDGLILRPFWGDAVLGWYGAAYKFIDGLNVIPSQLTLALFPVFSRYAASGGGTLVHSVELAMKALLTLAVPIAVGTMLLAEPIVRLVAGDAYVPHSVVALQILIWFLPFSFVNGLLQYVLIAVDQQRFITRSFLLAAAFNISGNLLLIPHLAYVGAALITIGSEVVLLGPFWYAVRRHVGPVKLLALAWRPALAAGAMGATTWALASGPMLATIAISAAVYALALVIIGGIGPEERAILRQTFSARGDRFPKTAL